MGAAERCAAEAMGDGLVAEAGGDASSAAAAYRRWASLAGPAPDLFAAAAEELSP